MYKLLRKGGRIAVFIIINYLAASNIIMKFIALVNREPFDYTEWQLNLFEGMLVRELKRS